MSLLNNHNFISFSGEPITGRTPPRTMIVGEQGLTAAQRGGVAHAYRLFCTAVNTSVAKYHNRVRFLEDGSKVQMVSNNGVDTVVVWPVSPKGGRVPLGTAEGFLATRFGTARVRIRESGIGICFTDRTSGMYAGFKRLVSAPGVLPEVYEPQPLILRPQTVDNKIDLPLVTDGRWAVERVTKLLGGNETWGAQDGLSWLSTNTPKQWVSVNVNPAWANPALFNFAGASRLVYQRNDTVKVKPLLASGNYFQPFRGNVPYPQYPRIPGDSLRGAMVLLRLNGSAFDALVNWTGIGTGGALIGANDWPSEFSEYTTIAAPAGFSFTGNIEPSSSGQQVLARVASNTGGVVGSAFINLGESISAVLRSVSVPANTGSSTPAVGSTEYSLSAPLSSYGSYPTLIRGDLVYINNDPITYPVPLGNHIVAGPYAPRVMQVNSTTMSGADSGGSSSTINELMQSYYLRDGTAFDETRSRSSSHSWDLTYNSAVTRAVNPAVGTSNITFTAFVLWPTDAPLPNSTGWAESDYVGPEITTSYSQTANYTTSATSSETLTHAGGVTTTGTSSRGFTVTVNGATGTEPNNSEVSVTGSFSSSFKTLLHMDTTTGDAIWLESSASATTDGNTTTMVTDTESIVFIGRAGTVVLVNDLPAGRRTLTTGSQATWRNHTRSSWLGTLFDINDWRTAEMDWRDVVRDGLPNRRVQLEQAVAAATVGSEIWYSLSATLARLIDVPDLNLAPAAQGASTVDIGVFPSTAGDYDVVLGSTASIPRALVSAVPASGYGFTGSRPGAYIYTQVAEDALTHAAIVHIRFDGVAYGGASNRSWVFVMDDTGCRTLQTVLDFEGANPTVWPDFNTSSLVSI